MALLALMATSPLTVLAGDGNPTPTCIPGHTCGDQDW